MDESIIISIAILSYLAIFIVIPLTIALYRKQSRQLILFNCLISMLVTPLFLVYVLAGAWGGMDGFELAILLLFFPYIIAIIFPKSFEEPLVETNNVNMMPVKEYAEKNDLPEEEVINMLREGSLNGRLIEHEWFVAKTKLKGPE